MSEPAAGDTPDVPDYCERCHHEFQPPVNEPVVDESGRQFDHAIDTDPATRLWCPDCWKAFSAEKHAEENHSLSTFGGGR